MGCIRLKVAGGPSLYRTVMSQASVLVAIYAFETLGGGGGGYGHPRHLAHGFFGPNRESRGAPLGEYSPRARAKAADDYTLVTDCWCLLRIACFLLLTFFYGERGVVIVWIKKSSALAWTTIGGNVS